MFFCDERDRLVAFATPRAGRRDNQERRNQYANQNKDFLFHDSALFENSEQKNTSAEALVAQPFPDGPPGFRMIANHPQRRRDWNGQNETHSSPYPTPK